MSDPTDHEEAMRLLGTERVDIQQSHERIAEGLLTQAEMKGRQAAIARVPESANPYHVKLNSSPHTDQKESLRDMAVAWYAGWRLGLREVARR
jgi:hypothetical protein